MEIKHKILGKVCLTCNGDWDVNKSYNELCIVLDGDKSYISKQKVPIGIDITDKDYWQYLGFSNTAYYELNIKSESNDSVEFVNFSYDSVESAINSGKIILISKYNPLLSKKTSHIVTNIYGVTDGYDLVYNDNSVSENVIGLHTTCIKIRKTNISFNKTYNYINIETNRTLIDDDKSKRFLASDGNYHLINEIPNDKINTLFT